MTRVDFLKLIPAAILALFWPEEAKAEANTPLSDIWEFDPVAYKTPSQVSVGGSNFRDGHDRVFVYGGETPGKIRATSATFTQPVNVRRMKAHWDKPGIRIRVDDEWLEGAE